MTPSVLIPRPETEELVSWIVEDHPDAPVRILDIGTGSGCIPVSLAHRLPLSTVHAWDVSPEALEVARRNAIRNGVTVHFQQVDALQESWPSLNIDVLVSNPPYITEKERTDMERNVLDWEPELALFVPDNDPLLFTGILPGSGSIFCHPPEPFIMKSTVPTVQRRFPCCSNWDIIPWNCARTSPATTAW